MERIGGYRICNWHGPYSEPNCQLCQEERNRYAKAALNRVSPNNWYRDNLHIPNLSEALRAALSERVDDMKQPTPEQLNDPDWWEENCDPDTKTIAVITDARGGFKRAEEFSWTTGGAVELDHPDDEVTFHPRPTKPSAPEWDGEGLPPVGCECEVSYAGYWVKAKVVHSTASGILVSEMFGKFPGKVHISVDPRQFRPIRTKEQREREEFARAIQDDLDICGVSISGNTAKDIAARFMNRGWRKPEGE